MRAATKKRAAATATANVGEFLKAVQSEKVATRCAVCDNKPVSAAIDEILAARKAGKANVSAVRVHRWLREQFNVTFSVSTLLACCRAHRRATWTHHGK